MKTYLVVTGILLSLLNGLLLVPAASTYTVPIAGIALALSLLILTLSWLKHLLFPSSLASGFFPDSPRTTARSHSNGLKLNGNEGLA